MKIECHVTKNNFSKGPQSTSIQQSQKLITVEQEIPSFD